MKIRSAVYSILIILFAVQNVSAQTFEGELSVVSFNNLDKKTEEFSSGVGYNGTERINFYSKGEKVLVRNLSLLYSILFDPTNNVVVYYCEGLKKGISVNYNDYWSGYAVFSKEPRSFMGQKLPEYSLYEFETIADSIQSFGCKAKFLRGRLENQHAGTDVELLLIPDRVISKALRLSLIHGLSVEGLPVKYRWTSHLKFEAAFKDSGVKHFKGKLRVGRERQHIDINIKDNLKSYMGREIIDIKENDNLEDSLFVIPTDIQIEKTNPASLHGFLTEVGKYLKSNNLFPNQRGEEVTYEINDEEWDY